MFGVPVGAGNLAEGGEVKRLLFPHYRLWLATYRVYTWLRVGIYYRARTDGLSAGFGITTILV
jgi:hypothetical protein